MITISKWKKKDGKSREWCFGSYWISIRKLHGSSRHTRQKIILFSVFNNYFRRTIFIFKNWRRWKPKFPPEIFPNKPILLSKKNKLKTKPSVGFMSPIPICRDSQNLLFKSGNKKLLLIWRVILLEKLPLLISSLLLLKNLLLIISQFRKMLEVLLELLLLNQMLKLIQRIGLCKSWSCNCIWCFPR